MSNYNFFNTAALEKTETNLPESLKLKGGAIEAHGGLTVDAQLTGVTLDSKDGSTIYISALAKLEDCVINGKDVLIEGKFSGTLNATGQTEFASGCVAVGIFNKGDDVYIHKLADIDDLKVMRLVQTTASATPQVALVSVNNGTY